MDSPTCTRIGRALLADLALRSVPPVSGLGSPLAFSGEGRGPDPGLGSLPTVAYLTKFLVWHRDGNEAGNEAFTAMRAFSGNEARPKKP